MTLAALNLLAFAWHSALDILEPPWQAARAAAAAKRTRFFAPIAAITAYLVFPSWRVLLESLASFTIPPEILKTQKNRRKPRNRQLLELLARHATTAGAGESSIAAEG
jgi:hypothetical protein